MLFTTISILYGALSITLKSDTRIALATLLAGVAFLFPSIMWLLAMLSVSGCGFQS